MRSNRKTTTTTEALLPPSAARRRPPPPTARPRTRCGNRRKAGHQCGPLLARGIPTGRAAKGPKVDGWESLRRAYTRTPDWVSTSRGREIEGRSSAGRNGISNIRGRKVRYEKCNRVVNILRIKGLCRMVFATTRVATRLSHSVRTGYTDLTQTHPNTIRHHHDPRHRVQSSEFRVQSSYEPTRKRLAPDMRDARRPQDPPVGARARARTPYLWAARTSAPRARACRAPPYGTV